MKNLQQKGKMPRWLPQRKSHFYLLVLLFLGLLFILFYFLLRNKAH